MGAANRRAGDFYACAWRMCVLEPEARATPDRGSTLRVGVLDQSGAERFGDDLRARPHIEGRRDFLEAILDRVGAQVDERADLLVGEAAGHVPDDRDVALGQARARPAAVAVGGVSDHAGSDLGVEHRVPAVDRADRPLHLGELDVLDEIALGAGVEALENDVVLAVAGQHHHGGAGRCGEDPPADFGSLNVFELDVEQHDVRTERLGDVDRLVAGTRLADDGDVGLALERLFETGPDDLVGVDDRDADAVQGPEFRTDAVAAVRAVPLHPLRHLRSPRLSARLPRLSRPSDGDGLYPRARVFSSPQTGVAHDRTRRRRLTARL